jgi:hypothetical protein
MNFARAGASGTLTRRIANKCFLAMGVHALHTSAQRLRTQPSARILPRNWDKMQSIASKGSGRPL